MSEYCREGIAELGDLGHTVDVLGEDGDVLAIVWAEELPDDARDRRAVQPLAASLIVRRRGSAAVRIRRRRLSAGRAAEVR